MISGKLKCELSIEEILSRTTPYSIYRHFFGDFEINKVTCNHLRGDRHPSLIIGNKYGELSHFDMAASEWRGDCFNLVKTIHNCSLDEALKIIDRELNLGILSGLEARNKPQIEIKEPEITKRSSLFQVITRRFTEKELNWWFQYYQTIEDLKENNIYSIKKLYFNKKLVPKKEDELCFGYFYPKLSTWKIYFAEREKRRKWMGNTPLNYAYGLENLDKDKNTIVTKALKDYLIIRKIYPYVCHVQNESLSAFSNENIEYLDNNSKEVFCNFDSDIPGKKASWEVTNKYGWKHINVPDNLYPIKDIADWAKNTNLETINEYFKRKGIYK